MSDLREELIQVAAVAAAIVEDLDYGEANFRGPGGNWAYSGVKILHDIALERFRQDKKWGPQHHDPAVWFTILMEEVGEAAQAALQGGLIEGAA